MIGGFVAAMLGVLASAGAAPAENAAERIAVLPVELGDAPAGAAASMRDQVELGLERAHFVVVDAEAALTERGTASCDRECLQAIATATSSSRLVRTTLTENDTVWSVTIDLIDGRTGDVEASAADTCEICGLDEVGQLVAARVAGLAERTRAMTSAPPILSVRVEPLGAAVSIDGTSIGTAPIRHEVRPGRHVVRVEHEGYAARERVVMSEAGVHESIAIELVPEDALPSDRRRRRTALGLGGASVAVGVLGIAAGISLLAIDGRDRRRDCNADTHGDCEFRFHTRTGGAVATAVGLAFVATGATVLGIVQARRKPRSTRASFHPGGFEWRF